MNSHSLWSPFAVGVESARSFDRNALPCHVGIDSHEIVTIWSNEYDGHFHAWSETSERKKISLQSQEFFKHCDMCILL